MALTAAEVDDLVVGFLEFLDTHIVSKTPTKYDDLAVSLLRRHEAIRRGAIDWLLSLFADHEEPTFERLPLMNPPELLMDSIRSEQFDYAELLGFLMKWGPVLVKLLRARGA